MSEGMNRVMLLGNLGGDPELRTTQGGTSVLHLRLATTESWWDRASNEAKERTDWHDVVVWGNRAEGLAKVLSKGDGLLIEGGLRTSSFERDGVKRYKTEIHAREVCFAGRPRAAMPKTDGETDDSNPRYLASRQMPVIDELPF